MSTRGLVCIYYKGGFVAASYNHSDSYPSSLGLELLDKLKTDLNFDDFKEKLKFISLLSPEEITQRWSSLGVNKGAYISHFLEQEFTYRYPHFQTLPGSDLVRFLANPHNNGPLIELKNSLSFAADSLFCEWCYVLDFDKNTFEVFKGFNEAPLDEDERFFFLTKESYKEHRANQYRPVKLVKSYSFNKLPDDDDFLLEVDPPEEDN